jgi:NAD(P)-dependent dehydrogenase (short-subunit alcohol dehydrogenase family)
MIGATLKEFRDVHVLVNNPGYVSNGPLHKIIDRQWDGSRTCTSSAVPNSPGTARLPGYPPVAEERNASAVVHRKVVNVSSVSATVGAAGQANYAAAKAGLHGLTRSLAQEWGSLAVNVNCAAFGYIETRLTQEISGRCEDQPPMKPLAASCSSASRSETMSRDRFVSGGLAHLDGQAIKSPVDSRSIRRAAARGDG